MEAQTPDAKLAAMLAERKVLPIGIHFGLDETLYHADEGIGSTQIRQLARNPEDYWYYSAMNPKRPPDKSTPGQLRGSAMHCFLFYGEATFDARYMRGPDQDGMTTTEKGASTKAANAKAASLGLECLKADHYDRAVIASAMIKKNPNLAVAFEGGMSEVSIIYEKDGVRRKARLDYLKLRGLGDLKGCANRFDKEFGGACIGDITNYHYHEQMSWYMDARAEIPKLVADGAVHGDHDPEWIKKLAAAKAWGWQWVFIQTEGAPITWSKSISPANPMVEIGRLANKRGIDNFKAYVDKYGREQWVKVEPVTELFVEEMPPWFAR